MASRYWFLVKIDSFGKCRTEEVEEAKAFLCQRFPELTDREDVPHRELQRQLMQRFHEDDTHRQMAEVCLRCFISNQIKDVCLELEQKFGKNHDFTSAELLPLVLDRTFRSPRQETDESQTTYPSVTTRILQSFDPDKSNLSTWTLTIVKSDRNLKQFLLEQGIEQLTDWMILSYMNPGRLQRVLSDFDRTQEEISLALQLLDSFHQVYRTQLFSHRQAGDKSRYPEPTAQQLRQMQEQLSGKRPIFANIRPQAGSLGLQKQSLPTQAEFKSAQADFVRVAATSVVRRFDSPEQVLEELQQLAQLLRSDRLRARKGLVRSEPLDKSESPARTNTTSSENEANEPSEFLADYRQQFDTCLAQSVQQVIQARFTYLQGKKNQKAQDFLKALHLFHCQGIPMKEIAPQLGLKDQPQVSRLLELKNLRRDIGRRMLLCLRNRVLKLAQCYVDPVQLRDLDSKLQSVLGEEIAKELEKSKRENHIGHNRVMNSQFSRTICQHLDSRKEER